MAQVDKTQLSTNQKLHFSITVAGPLRKPPEVELTTFEGFQLVSTGQSQEIQAKGRQLRQALTLTYTLAPTTPGLHTLGPVKVEYEGRTYETQPIRVKVISGRPGRGRKQPPELKDFKDPDLEGGVIL